MADLGYTDGGNRVPASIQLTGGTWAGAYANPSTGGDGLISYWGGPNAPGTIRLNMFQETQLPPMHVSFHPSDPAGTLHLSFATEGKNLHLYYQGGSPNWDWGALDQNRRNLVEAINQQLWDELVAYLEQAYGQIALTWQQAAGIPEPSYDSPAFEVQDSSLFSVPPEAVFSPDAIPNAYLDEMDGDVLVFACGDLSLAIGRDELEHGISVAASAPGPYVRVIYGSYPNGAVVPLAFFTQT
jgi:hypothetical protein